MESPFERDPSRMKLIGFDRKMEGVSHILEARLPSSSSAARRLLAEELGEIEGVVDW